MTTRRLVGLILLVIFGAALFTFAPDGSDNTPTNSDELGSPERPLPARVDIDGLDTCPADLETVPALSDQKIRIVKVEGLIDPVVKSRILSELSRVENNEDIVALVIWMNSRGSVLSDSEFLDLATRLKNSEAETALWIGQVGSTARGGSAELAAVVDHVAVTPFSTIGQTGPTRLPTGWNDSFGEAAKTLETDLLTADQAVQAGFATGPLIDVVQIFSFMSQLDNAQTFSCIEIVQDEDGNETGTALRSVLQNTTEISSLTLAEQMFHTASSPEVAYLFFAMGLGLLLFELFTAGVGVAGLVGVGFLTLGSYGLAALPTNWWGLALILLSVLLLAVDVQTNVPRFYTVAGLVSFALGSVFLYDGLRASLVTIAAGIGGSILYAYAGMPTMVRTRFSTPTIGRKWMIGELGEALTAVSPEGTVEIKGAQWSAVANRATPIEQGDTVRVVGVDRLLLEVEPEEGGAKDYRDRS